MTATDSPTADPSTNGGPQRRGFGIDVGGSGVKGAIVDLETGQLIGERSFVSPLVPPAGGMRLHVNLWAFAGNAPTDQQEVEVVIRDIVSTGAVLAAESSPAATEPALSVRHTPSRGGVDLSLVLPADDWARVTILDVAGRRIRILAHGTQTTGVYEASWDGLGDDGSRVQYGMYFLRAAVGTERTISRVMYLHE